MILGKLKESTRKQHEDLETIVGVMDKLFSREDYTKMLTRFYVFYSSIEPQIAKNDLSSYGYDLDARQKTAALERDHTSLGVFDQIKKLEGSWSDLPDLSTPAKAFGACYVLEGATLGGQIITRHLKQHLDLTPENGGSFFNSYGERVGPMWKEFGSTITEFADKADDDESIVNAAKETFDSFGRCIISE